MMIVRMALARVQVVRAHRRACENSYNSLVDLLRRETDYMHEAECMTRMAKNFEDDPDILFPERGPASSPPATS